MFIMLFLSVSKTKIDKKGSDHEGIRTLNLLIRSQTPYPLGHAATRVLVPNYILLTDRRTVYTSRALPLFVFSHVYVR